MPGTKDFDLTTVDWALLDRQISEFLFQAKLEARSSSREQGQPVLIAEMPT